jgi:ADP-ribose pyrophosphatase YjhB (NUDIX family)
MRQGEPAEEAVVREVYEETSIRVRTKRLISVCESLAPDQERHIVHFLYETEYVCGEPGVSQDPRVRRSLFTPISSLDRIELRPPVQHWLRERLLDGFSKDLEHLGALWV